MWAFQNILHCIASFSVPLFRYRYGASAETFPDLFPSRCESWRDLGTSNIHPTPNLTFCGYKLSLFQIVLNPFSLFRPIGQLLVGDPGAPGNFCRVWGDRHLGKRQWAKSKLHLLLLLFILGPPCQPEVNPAFFASHNYSREGRIGPEAQKPKTFRIAAFYAQIFSGRSARIHFSRHIKKRVVLSHDISKKCVTLSRH